MKNVFSSVIAIVVLTAVFGFAYPALMTGFGQAAFSTQANGNLIFVAFSSKADYGILLSNTGSAGAHRAQLWMSAIDLSKTATGNDPSFPPIWLPFQNVTQTNHLPFWTTTVTCASAGTAADNCGEGQVCDNGICRTSSP